MSDAEQTKLDEYVEEVVGESEPQEEDPKVEAEPEVIPEVEIPKDEDETVVEGDEPKEPKTEKIQERFDKLTADKYEEKRRADGLQAQLDQMQQAQQAAPIEAPTLEDYDYDEDAFQTASIDYGTKIATAQAATQQANAAITQEQVIVQSTFDEKMNKFTSDNPDFVTVQAKVPILHPIVLDALKRQDNAPEIINHLGNQQDKAYQVASMNPVLAVAEIGRISALISQPKPVKTTSAPKPIDALTSGGVVESNIGATMPIDQWMAKYNP